MTASGSHRNATLGSGTGAAWRQTMERNGSRSSGSTADGKRLNNAAVITDVSQFWRTAETRSSATQSSSASKGTIQSAPSSAASEASGDIFSDSRGPGAGAP